VPAGRVWPGQMLPSLQSRRPAAAGRGRAAPAGKGTAAGWALLGLRGHEPAEPAAAAAAEALTCQCTPNLQSPAEGGGGPVTHTEGSTHKRDPAVAVAEQHGAASQPWEADGNATLPACGNCSPLPLPTCRTKSCWPAVVESSKINSKHARVEQSEGGHTMLIGQLCSLFCAWGPLHCRLQAPNGQAVGVLLCQHCRGCSTASRSARQPAPPSTGRKLNRRATNRLLTSDCMPATTRNTSGRTHQSSTSPSTWPCIPQVSKCITAGQSQPLCGKRAKQ